MVLQRIRKELQDDLVKAQKYYSILSIINDLNLTNRDIDLLAFLVIEGGVLHGGVRELFCNKYETSSATINNIVSKLKKLKILIKQEGKIKINPVIILDFKKPITLQIQLLNNVSREA